MVNIKLSDVTIYVKEGMGDGPFHSAPGSVAGSAQALGKFFKETRRQLSFRIMAPTTGSNKASHFYTEDEQHGPQYVVAWRGDTPLIFERA